MSGGSNPLKGAFGGDGMAWRREQADILSHAKDLGYDRAGGSIIPQTDNKADWEKWKSGFLSWRQKNVDLEKEGKAFWQQSAPTAAREEAAPAAPAAPLISPIQAAASRNSFFPMLVADYSAPQAYDYSAYTKMSPFGGMGGLLYQPGTAQYQQAFPMNEGILRYQPPQLGLIPVSYSNPYVLNMELMEEEGEEGKPSDDKKTSDAGDDQRGGRDGRGGYDPDRGFAIGNDGKGYQTDKNSGLPIGPSGYPSVDLGLATGIGVSNNNAGWGNAEAGVGVGVSSGSGKGPAAGGMGKGY